ncbi:MAG: nicotinate phosphoribosyltransferase, partial [Tissierellaceae bacterium]
MENFNWQDKRNLSMLADFYEFTMANGFLENKMEDRIAYFDMFFREIPENGGFAIMAGVEQVIDYLKNLK